MTNFRVQIHPAAECVRLMDAEELASLAASIEAHGQRDPIILGRVNGAASEALIDGRNRLKACEIAGVEPRFEVLQFEDDEAVKAFVADKSEHRNLTKAQQAMRVALLWPEPEKGGRGKRSRIQECLDESRKTFQNRMSQARQILAYSRETALAVRDGNKRLDEALVEVKAAREALQSQEGKLAQLRNDAPDLADLVDEDRMPLSEASAALEQRQREAEEKEKNRREVSLRITEGAYRNLISWGNSEFVADMRALVEASPRRPPQYPPLLHPGQRRIQAHRIARVAAAAPHLDEHAGLRPG
jgi:ParB-like nuclease domain